MTETRQGHPLRQEVDFEALRNVLRTRLGQPVEIVARLPTQNTPGVVIVEDLDGNDIAMDPEVMDQAIEEVAGRMSPARRALMELDAAETVEEKIAAIRDWLAHAVEEETK